MGEESRVQFWRFLLCWFVPGFVYLSLGIALKSHHYAFPILPPLSVPAALGLAYYVRRQAGLWNRHQGVTAILFLAGCVIAGVVVAALPHQTPDMKRAVIVLIGAVAVGGAVALYLEQARLPGAVLAAYFMTAWVVGVGVQSLVMPAQDDYKPQADFARAVNGSVPPGVTVYLLGHREEEQEADDTYYLRFPMQRLATAEQFADAVRAADAPTYAVAPAGMSGELAGVGKQEVLTTCSGLRPGEMERDRLTLLRVTPR